MEIDEQTKTFTLEKYIRRAVEGVRHKGRGNEIKVCCPFCGDKEYKGTLWLTNTYRWCYTCWRASCQCSDHGILATKWLREVSPSMYNEYLEELKGLNKKTQKDLDAIKEFIERKKEIDAMEQKKRLEEAMAKDRREARHFKKISVPGRCQSDAIAYCKKRMIPEEVWSKFYYCDDGKYHDRVIIPFFTAAGKIEFFQGRTLIDDDAKYLSRVGHTALYNWDFVDKTKPIAVLEGPINSIFVENSTATVGAGSSKELDEQLKNLDCWFIYDNDKSGKKKAWKKVNEEKPVLMWNKLIFLYNLPSDINDINDVILFLKRTKKFSIAELRGCFTRYPEQYKAIELATEESVGIKPKPDFDEPELEEQ